MRKEQAIWWAAMAVEQLERAESEAADWKAKYEAVEHAFQEHVRESQRRGYALKRVEARLAGATELLDQVRASSHGRRWIKRIDAFLANAPTRTERIIESGDGVTITAVSVTPTEAAALSTGGARIPRE